VVEIGPVAAVGTHRRAHSKRCLELGEPLLHLIVFEQAPAPDESFPAMRQSFVEQALEEAHAHTGELQAAAVQHVQHHSDPGRGRLEPLHLGNPDVDPVATVRNVVEPEVVEVFLYLDALVGGAHVADEEVDIPLEVAVLILLAGSEKPEICPAGEAAPMLEPFEMIVILPLVVGGLHAQGFRAIAWLGHHQAAHVLVFEKPLKDRGFDGILCVLRDRL